MRECGVDKTDGQGQQRAPEKDCGTTGAELFVDGEVVGEGIEI